MSNSVDNIIAVCDELRTLLSVNGVLTSYGMKLLAKLQRLSLNLGMEESSREDDEEEESGGHGNTKIPFGLCEREGISVDPSWTPFDAWNALAEKGYSVEGVYNGLRDNGSLGGENCKMKRQVDQNVVNALKPPKDGAVFFSGCAERGESGDVRRGSEEVARKFAEGNDGTTANMLLQNAQVPDWNDEDDSMDVWRDVSRVMAQNAKGKVRVVVKYPLRKGNIFEAVELPTLKKNPYVTSVTVIDMNTGEEKEIFRRGK